MASSRKRDAASSPPFLNDAEIDAAGKGCKRTKLPPPPGRTIRDVLPDSLVAAVSDFLPVPSRLMTAVALGGGNTNGISGAAVASLDFEQVEEELAGRLTDDHLESMLRLSDAATGLRILKLAGCTNITGSGLRPLRGSRVLCQVDFTLRGNHEAFWEEGGGRGGGGPLPFFLLRVLRGIHEAPRNETVQGRSRFVPAVISRRRRHSAEGRLVPQSMGQ